MTVPPISPVAASNGISAADYESRIDSLELQITKLQQQIALKKQGGEDAGDKKDELEGLQLEVLQIRSQIRQVEAGKEIQESRDSSAETGSADASLSAACKNAQGAVDVLA